MRPVVFGCRSKDVDDMFGRGSSFGKDTWKDTKQNFYLSISSSAQFHQILTFPKS